MADNLREWAASWLGISQHSRLKDAEQAFKQKIKVAIMQNDKKAIMLLFCARDIFRGVQ